MTKKVNMKKYEIEGFFGYWGMYSTVYIYAKNKTEAFRGLKTKVMEIMKPYGKGCKQKKFTCKPFQYRVIPELEAFTKIQKKDK